MKLNLILYNLISYLLLPLFLLTTFLKSYLKQRTSPFKILLELLRLKEEKGQYIWLQAASAGEVLLANTIIAELTKEQPELKWLIYTTTYSGLTMAQNKIGAKAKVIYLPWDIALIIRRLVNAFPPKLLIIIESDFWPNLLHRMKQSAASVIMVNGKVSNRTWKRYQRMKFFIKAGINNVDLFLMQTESDRKRLLELGAGQQKVKIGGNLKFDQRFPEVTEDEREQLRAGLKLQDQKIIIAGSTHEGEEPVIIEAFLRLNRNFPDSKLIIAPRHLERLGQLETYLKQQKIAYQLRSRITVNVSDDFKIIILDTMGELSKLYSLAYCSFIGGSLVNIGGHNLLEPIAQGSPVLYGPYLQNFQDIEQLVANYEVGFKVADSNDLFQQWQKLMTDEQFYQVTREKTTRLLNDNRGLIKETLREIVNLL
ncbi:MAG TPA: glycosyltransferase N-terminal domain-containing protein [Bacillota bacterium]|nr:glycosyltransferase N-terminal domain-containing protein [Bacillota bacterium]HOL08713.1 glycosyltransferase N-terminal domain-containing protein [Bacillota bacterium]HPO96384.1 glycosyltransferase N-terminal domain-containing protein [Bacillota bacterium]